MVQFPNSPATEETMRRCLVLWILLENQSRSMPGTEISNRVPAMIRKKFGSTSDYVWPGIKGTDSAFEDMEYHGLIVGSVFTSWSATQKGKDYLESAEARFLPA